MLTPLISGANICIVHCQVHKHWQRHDSPMIMSSCGQKVQFSLPWKMFLLWWLCSTMWSDLVSGVLSSFTNVNVYEPNGTLLNPVRLLFTRNWVKLSKTTICVYLLRSGIVRFVYMNVEVNIYITVLISVDLDKNKYSSSLLLLRCSGSGYFRGSVSCYANMTLLPALLAHAHLCILFCVMYWFISKLYWYL